MTEKNKEEIRQSMLEHLKTKGYPNMSRDQIVEELAPMWDKLEAEGLLVEPIKEGMTFQHFVNIALQKKYEFDTLEEVEKYFSGRRNV